ncbi:MAG TPA: TadE/TadG family type IV pilus assembly protein [Streptosporangiaceae bacterium]|nr:TadE/TadG family type IV pilus assembly protein [Streptosporangiaceae bacterium]
MLPFLFLFIMAMIQASLWFLAREAALAAARQGADAARILHAPTSAGLTAALSFARLAGKGYLFDPTVVEAGTTSRTVAITVSGRVPSFVPGLVVRVSETVLAPVEEFRS